MAVAEYILVEGRSIPEWISDGGYWVNPDGSKKMIGIGNDGSIPEGTTTFTLAELQSRQRAIHASYPMVKGETADSVAIDEVNAMIKEWYDARS